MVAATLGDDPALRHWRVEKPRDGRPSHVNSALPPHHLSLEEARTATPSSPPTSRTVVFGLLARRRSPTGAPPTPRLVLRRGLNDVRQTKRGRWCSPAEPGRRRDGAIDVGPLQSQRERGDTIARHGRCDGSSPATHPVDVSTTRIAATGRVTTSWTVGDVRDLGTASWARRDRCGLVGRVRGVVWSGGGESDGKGLGGGGSRRRDSGSADFQGRRTSMCTWLVRVCRRTLRIRKLLSTYRAATARTNVAATRAPHRVVLTIVDSAVRRVNSALGSDGYGCCHEADVGQRQYRGGVVAFGVVTARLPAFWV